MIFSKLLIVPENGPQDGQLTMFPLRSILHRHVRIVKGSHADFIAAISCHENICVASMAIDKELDGLFWAIHENHLAFNGIAIDVSTKEEMDEVIWRLYV